MPTALIVEDEPEANHLLAMLVQLRGYRTDSAYSGGEALEKVGQNPPDIVFLDLMLPDINGYEVCKSIKARRTTSLIPVIMVTARVAAENRLNCFSVGADDFISKPYTPDQIYQAMADADAVRRDIEAGDSQGEIVLERHDDGVALRQIAQVRTFLLARSAFDLDSIARIGAALAEIAIEAEGWGDAHCRDRVATLHYLVQDDQLTFTLNDTSGWLTEGLAPTQGRWPMSFAAARFDEVKSDDAGHRLTLIKRLPAAHRASAE